MSPHMHLYARRSAMVAWDAAAWLLSLLAFSLIRYDLVLSERRWGMAVAYTVCAILDASTHWVQRSHVPRTQQGR